MKGEENSYEGSNKFKPISLLWMRLISSEVIVMIISAVENNCFSQMTAEGFILLSSKCSV